MSTGREVQSGSASQHAGPPMTSRRFMIDALHVFSLTSLVIAQCFYDRLAQQAEYLVDPAVTPAAIAGMVVTLSIGLPLLVVGLEYLAELWNSKIRDALHLSVVLLCSILFLLQVLQRATFLPGWIIVVSAPGGACVMTWFYARFSSLRSVVTICSLGILIFPAILSLRLMSADASVAHRAIHDSSGPTIPVVLVVFDEFSGSSLMTPEREIDLQRFPNFAALQQSSTWYRSASSVSPTTMRALPAILTGKFTLAWFTSSPTALPQNLFSLLSSAGSYDIAAFEPVSVLAPRRQVIQPQSLREFFGQTASLLGILGRVYLYEISPADFHAQLPLIPPVWFGFHDSAQVDRSARRGTFRYGWTDRRDEQIDHFLNCLDRTPQPVLYFGHFLLPHAPWCYFPTGTRYAEDRDSQDRLCLESDDNIMDDELGVIQNQQRHLLQVMYVDQQVGRITERLKETGIWDSCLLIITADHGVSFRLGQDRREYSGGNSEDILSVPLFIKFPGQVAGEVSDLPVQSIDLLPTVLDVIGIQPELPTDGLSVRDSRIALREQIVVHDPQNHLSFPLDVVRQLQGPALIRRRFGVGTDRWNIFRIGPHSEWLGQTVSSLPTQTQGSVRLECRSPTAAPSPTSLATLPYHIEGRVTSSSVNDMPVELVAAVDGIICGTTRTYRQFGHTDRWSVMLPEWSDLSGSVAPVFYSVSEDGSLAPCTMLWVDELGEPVDGL